jgi:hypothetical protein
VQERDGAALESLLFDASPAPAPVVHAAVELAPVISAAIAYAPDELTDPSPPVLTAAPEEITVPLGAPEITAPYDLGQPSARAGSAPPRHDDDEILVHEGTPLGPAYAPPVAPPPKRAATSVSPFADSEEPPGPVAPGPHVVAEPVAPWVVEASVPEVVEASVPEVVEASVPEVVEASAPEVLETIPSPPGSAKDAPVAEVRPSAPAKRAGPSRADELLASFAPSDGLDEKAMARNLKISVGLDPTPPPPAAAPTAIPPTVIADVPELQPSPPPGPSLSPSTREMRPPRAPRTSMGIMFVMLMLALTGAIALWVKYPAFFTGSH